MDSDRVAQAVAGADSWNARVALIRRVPEEFGRASLREVYSAIAQAAYVPHLTPDFAYTHQRDDYDLPSVEESLRAARAATADFTEVSAEDLRRALTESPKSMRCFRLIMAFTPPEMAAATVPVAASLDRDITVTPTTVKNLEAGRHQRDDVVTLLAETIHRGVTRQLFPSAAEGLRSKQERPDLTDGWESVRHFLVHGVTYAMFLHQRHYGGAFRQLLDATSTKRGDILEDAVEELFTTGKIRFVRTGSHNQAEIAQRFHLTVQPAPDFVLYDEGENLRGLLECKAVNDGGTARDKAARFKALREAAQIHGGVPVFAVLGGLGWARTSDALGPVIEACDGRVFSLSNLHELLTVDPLPSLSS